MHNRHTLGTVVAVWLLTNAACGDDEGAGLLSTSGSGESTGGDDGVDDEGADDEGADVTGSEIDPCDVDGALLSGSFDVVLEPAETIVVADGCGDPNLVGAGGDPLLVPVTDNFNVYVYRPATNGQWPAGGPRPAIFFVPGGGQRVVADGTTIPPVERYPEILRALAAQGFVVFAGTPPFNSSGDNFTSSKRATMLACMMVWAKGDPNDSGWPQADQDRISEAAILSGHSRGGGATTILLNNIDALQQQILEMGQYELCAGAPIAPKWSDQNGADNLVIAEADAPPWLVMQDALDEDTERGGGYVYDTMVPEPDLDLSVDPGVQVAPLRANDKMLVWVHGTAHNNFGGTFAQQISANAALRARRAASYYMPQFLVAQLANTTGTRNALMRLMDPAPSDLEFPALPVALEDPDIWDDLPQYAVLERPLIFASYQQGIAGADDRYVIDTWDRQVSGQLAPPTCGNMAGSLGTSTAGFPVAVDEGLLGSQVCHATTLETLSAEGVGVQNVHNTRAALVEWGESLGSGGTIEWTLDDAEDVAELDISQFSHVSLRVSNVVDVDPVDCDAIALDAFELEVEIVSEDGDGELHSHVATTGLNIDQSAGFVTPALGGTECKAFQFLRTVRIPLSDFCEGPDAPMSTEAIKAIRVRFPDDAGAEHRAFVDSLEFTRDLLDPGSATCGPFPGAWNCVAGAGLVVKETSCSAEPAPGCPSNKIVLNNVTKPTVAADSDWPSSFSGWVAYSPKGWVRNLQAPTTTELARIKGLCQEACALEWSDDPKISATCTASNAFATPTLRKPNAIGPVHRIPESRLHGGGIFGSQSLACDLESNCCDTFDELTCAAKHRRTTTATRAVKRAEEYRMNLGGTPTKVTFTTPSGSTNLPLVGTVGFSFCPQGDGSVNCPFYLGSLEVASNSSVQVNATCPDTSSISLDVSDLSIKLLQPAFGIADQTDFDKAIPEGGLHFLASVAIDGATFSFRAVNEHDVIFMSAKTTGFDSDDITLTFDVPCGAGTIPVTAQFDLHNTSTSAAPPALTINNASTGPCPSTRTLSATASDPNGDLVTPVRWEVDGVRMVPGISTMAFTRNHVLTAYARDVRGATTTKTKTVTCQ